MKLSQESDPENLIRNTTLEKFRLRRNDYSFQVSWTDEDVNIQALMLLVEA